MAPRLELQALFTELLGSENVYFQPPESGSGNLKFPCIIYTRSQVDIKHADNAPYKHKKRYQVTYIDRDPDSVINDKILALPTCSYDRSFASDDLNHDVYQLFF